MTGDDKVSSHYSSGGDLAARIAGGLQGSGRSLDHLTPRDLSAIDEFHFRGRPATLKLAARMKLSETSRVLDIGSGFGGAGFRIIDVHDSTEASLDWLEARSVKMAASKSPPITLRILFGDDFPRMIDNQAIGLRERRVRTVAFYCEA